MRTEHIDPQQQLDLFREAVNLLGGQRAAARYLDVNERHVRYLVAGERTLSDRFLRDVAAALIKHAAECRAMEQKISPAFAANRTAEQHAAMAERARAAANRDR